MRLDLTGCRCVVFCFLPIKGPSPCSCASAAVLQARLFTITKKDNRMVFQTADETQDSLNRSIPFMSLVLNLRLPEGL